MTLQIEGRVREAGSGRGLENVCVSNGEHVARTDAGGRYGLEIEPGGHRFVWVSVPDGFRLPADFYRSTRGWDVSRRDVDFELVPRARRGAPDPSGWPTSPIPTWERRGTA